MSNANVDETADTNLTEAGRRNRFWIGLAWTAVGGATAAWMASANVPRAARIVLVAPYLAGGISLAQSAWRT